ncbi:hypothetical protein [Frankia sp. Cppng1_Ct_nod]|uniref:hypothetical protein n=1 Tax=Frankia sp. Cppng1_Ct_nod TaxID=2897162 RepID=UPI00202502FD|nr:hypothetical protein [Frankia sp. Cppng1_Ct_nod]
MAAGRAGDRQEQIAEIMRCTSLNPADSEVLAVLLTDLDGRRSRPGGRWDVGIGLGSVVLLAGVALLNADPALPFATRPWILAAVQAGVVLAYLMFTATGLWTGRGRPESRAAIQIFTILEKLTPNSRSTDSSHPRQRWKKTDFRGEIAADLERAAILVERIPLAWRGLAPAVRAETLRVSRVKADGLRELQLRTVTPTDSTLTDLVGQLNVALKLLIDGRWHDLPDPQSAMTPVTARSRVRQWAVITAAGMAAAGMVALTAFSVKLGPVAPMLTTLASVTVIGLLHRAGISMPILGQITEVGGSIRGENRRPD